MEPCNADVFKNGHGICALDACSQRAEEWVQSVAKESGQKVDWHYSGGIANVLFIGDYDKVLAAIKKLEPELAKTPICTGGCRCSGNQHSPGRLMRIFPADAHGLYRAGDELPDGAVGVDT